MYYDNLETRDAAAREAALGKALVAQITNARDNAPYYAAHLKDVAAAAVSGREALSGLPLTRKSDLIELQAKTPPLGGLNTVEPGRLSRIFQSPGPINEGEGGGADPWRIARGLYAAGFRAGDLVHNTFAYHFTPAGAMLETGARALGCAVFPAGVGQTELQVAAITAMRPTAYAGTPSFLRILLEKGRETGADLGSLKKGSVTGEALPPSLRAELADLGVDVLQLYAVGDIGLVAYESEAREGLIVNEDLIVEIVRPGTGDPLPDGEVGEVVVTTFTPEYPLIRLATGDLSAVMAGVSPCGRTNMRLKGWMGRADQATKVKGMFVQPSQIAQVLRRHPEIAKARLVVGQEGGIDVMTLHCEVADGGGEALEAAVTETIHAVCKLKGRVAFAAPASLANDGKVIEDQRTYE